MSDDEKTTEQMFEQAKNENEQKQTPGVLARVFSFLRATLGLLVTPVKWVGTTRIGGFFKKLLKAAVPVACIVAIGYGGWVYRGDLQAFVGIDPRPEASLAALLQEGAELRREAETMKNRAEGIRVSVAIKAPAEARHLSPEQMADAKVRLEAIMNALADNDRSPVVVNANSAPAAGTQTSAYAYLIVMSNGTTQVDVFDAKGLVEAFEIMGVETTVPNLSGSGWLGVWGQDKFGIRWGGERLF